ncbi:CopG family transcriptional regulator [Pseudomonas putida]|uniref:CopG family transcriptional regulator n=1 Tax=Pseudomonas putida TaxID=303 RepID=UPI0022DE7EC2|nr:CopG family transcriptional regulator [Pseudomonas putida]WBM49629.1 CopG family transcriptional regulator [Pseudomonas putida]
MSGLNDDERRRTELTREALADVDTDLVVDHQLVEAWAKSLSTDSPWPPPTPVRPA